MKRLAGNIAFIFAAFTAAALILSAYGGCVSPVRSTIPALATMAFPVIALIAVIAAISCLFFSGKSALLLLGALLICSPTILTYFPLNISSSSPDSGGFSLMTYNVCNLSDFTRSQESPHNNPTLQFILNRNADIVALQECATFTHSPEAEVSKSLLDSLFAKYPYHTNGPEGQAILSKYPFREIRLHHRARHDFQVRAYTVCAPADTFTLFNLHLKSIGLNPDDKELYRDITKGKSEGAGLRNELRDIKHSLISKLSAAFRDRAVQAEKVKQLIDSIGGPVIVCGDFNDVPTCHAIRTIESAGLKDAYSAAALGYAVTYHADRFYFRIDHILYRGFHPSGVKRISVPYSDHYPLIATFTPAG